MRHLLGALIAILLLIPGCNTAVSYDTAKGPDPAPTLSFSRPMPVGSAERSPADPYLDSGAGRVYLSWTEQAEGSDGRNVLVAPLEDNGAKVGEPRRMNASPVKSRVTGERIWRSSPWLPTEAWWESG